MKNNEIRTLKFNNFSAAEWGNATNCGWSGWTSRDSPTRASDNEKISEYIKFDQLADDQCEVPVAIQARKIGSTELLTDEKITIDSNGFKCQNTDQPGVTSECSSEPCPCSDYEIRMCCDGATTPAPSTNPTTAPPLTCEDIKSKE